MKYMRSVRELREAHHVTREQLAAQLGMPVAALTAWEEGRASPTPAQLEQLARRFLVPVAQLRDDAPAADLRSRGPRSA